MQWQDGLWSVPYQHGYLPAIGGLAQYIRCADALTGGQPQLGYRCTLLRWHAQDPVSEPERQRHARVAHWQGNRHPFIDHPEWVAAVWGETDCTTPATTTITPASVPSITTPATTLPGPIIANRRSKVYHRPDCPSYRAVAVQNQVMFPTVAAAEAAGYRVAGNCP
jgi:deoxyribonuclease-1